MTGSKALAGAAAALLAGCAFERTQTVEKSMEPTILSGEIVKVDRDAYDEAAPEAGDIVEVRAPAGAEEERCGGVPRAGQACPRPTPGLSDLHVVKRVVAVPGDRVAIGPRGEAIVDGEPVDRHPIILCAPERDDCELPVAMTVPARHYFLLGDNRPYSSDSRHWGPVPREAIQGHVTPPDPARR